MHRMIISRLIARHNTLSNKQLHTSIKLLRENDSSSSSDSSDSDNEKPKQNRKKFEPIERDEKSKKETINILNNLLANMSSNTSKPKTMNRAIPKRIPLPKPVPKPTLEEKLIGAAKDVATTIGGDVEKTEAELLDKIFSAGAPSPPPESKSESPTSSEPSLSNLFADMKIDKKKQQLDEPENYVSPRAYKMEEMARKFQNIDSTFVRRKSQIQQEKPQPVNLYSGKPLNIFDSIPEKIDETPKLETWSLLHKKELDLMLTHPPTNILEEMIQWTEKGILWKFPINNEIGMEEEENVHFSEHVFMERHIQDWCPTKGPIRHFMELVCVGLSKNPYMTVKEKKDHIMWYREFFGSKQELLKEVGAITDDILPSNQKQIEA